jgi:hypothetical protein
MNGIDICAILLNVVAPIVVAKTEGPSLFIAKKIKKKNFAT